MKKRTLAIAIFLILSVHISAFAEYNVEWQTMNTRNFICGDVSSDQTSFEVKIRYDLVTTHTEPKVAIRKEIRLTVFEVNDGVSMVDTWASEILSIPMTQVVVGFNSAAVGNDKIQKTFGAKFEASANINPSIGTSYKFSPLYYSSGSVASFKSVDDTLSRLFIDYQGTVQFKFISEHSAKFSISLSQLRAFAGLEASSATQVKNIDMNRLKMDFSNLSCTEK